MSIAPGNTVHMEAADVAIKLTVGAMTRYRAHLILGHREEAEVERQRAKDGLDAFFDHLAAAITKEVI